MEQQKAPKSRSKGATSILVLTFLVIGIAVSGLLRSALPAKAHSTFADRVLMNGQIYTVDANLTWAQAVAIKDGEIQFVGSDADAIPYIDAHTEVVDLAGKFVMPAFVDSHMHPSSNAYAYLFTAALFDLHSHDDYINEITAFANANPTATGIRGSGYDRGLYDEIGPRKEWLDAIDSTRPMCIMDVDLHSAWVNSKTLDILGITKDTPDPEGGVIQRDPITGEPTGLLIEYAAYNPALSLMPAPPLDEYKTGLLWLQDQLNAKGITSVHDAWGELEDPIYYRAYDELAKAGKLSVRYRISCYIDPQGYKWQIRQGKLFARRYNHPHFNAHSFKFLLDGSLEGETALLLKPYANRPGYFGERIWDQSKLIDAFSRVDQGGYQIHAHVIGDRATRDAVDALEAVEQINGPRDSRHSLAHVQMARPADVIRMGDLGLSAHMSPYWMGVDDGFWTTYLRLLGPKRTFWQMYPHKSMMDAGVNVTVSSDWATSQPDFMSAIYSGMNRIMPYRVFQETYGSNPNVRYVSDPFARPRIGDIRPLLPLKERVSLANMIQASTWNGAYANFLEDQIGSIEVGKKADLVVLSQNLFQIPVEAIPDVEIESTYFEGRKVH